MTHGRESNEERKTGETVVLTPEASLHIKWLLADDLNLKGLRRISKNKCLYVL
jgi:hypothetical protein